MDVIEPGQLLRFIAALAFVIGLMGALALLVRRLNGGLALAQGPARRLAVTERLPLDARRQAVLLRRDGREHLVILGPNGETLIESGIIPVSGPVSGQESENG